MKKKQSPYEKLKVEFENTYGDYLPDEEFQNIYENFKKDGISVEKPSIGNSITSNQTVSLVKLVLNFTKNYL